MKISDKTYYLMTNDPSTFLERIREQLCKKKRLDTETFCILCRFCKSKHIYSIIESSLSMKEVTLLGHAMRKAKRLDVDSFLPILTREHSTKNATLLTCMLLKRSKIKNTRAIVDFLKPMLSSETRLCYLQLLLVIYRNYRAYFDESLKAFCMQSNHPICVEIKEKLSQEKIHHHRDK